MTYREYSEKLSTVALLAEKCATGTPRELSSKLDVSEKTARRMISHLRQQGKNIKYCRIRRTYMLK